MTPERIAELREHTNNGLVTIYFSEILDLLSTAEQAVRMREAIQQAIDAAELDDHRRVLVVLRAALSPAKEEA